MKKDLVFGVVGLLVLVGLGIFVSAWVGEVSFNFSEGWNLVYGLGDINQLEGQLLEKGDVKAIWGFIPTTQEYVQMYPNVDFSKVNLIDDDELMNTAFWVYTEKGALSEYWLAEEVVPLKDRPMYAGWNFVGVTPDMKGMRIADNKGGCNILKICDYARRNWDCLDGANMGTHTFGDQDSDLGRGLAIKVSSNCRLGAGSSAVNPPALP